MWRSGYGPGIHSLISGELTPSEAIDQQVVHILSGESALLDRFAETFHIPTG